ncbi:hypothetical protein SteCoe_33074 [Stentor coeruleus]|uniref:Major facilitator superfamily (MFS) profile domain-containing protein n=1 Tax=Stentor coeruleus TaxID=5963 RepID=A0A1R2AXI5_9CILI|nr:hypothetical protein SteCoe_33074 [Stentor coeruleus]
MSDKVLLGLYGLGMIGPSIQSILAPFFPLVAHKKNISDKMIGTIFGIQPLIAGICSPIYGMILSKYGRKKIILTAAFLMILSALAFAIAPTFDGDTFISVCLLSRFFQGVGGSGIATSIVAIFSTSYRERLEEIFGIQQSLTGVSLIIGPLIGMGLFAIGGFSFMLYCFAAIFFVGFAYLLIVLPPDEDVIDTKNPVSWIQMLRVKSVLMDFFAICVAYGSLGALEPILQGFLQDTYKIKDEYVAIFFVIPSLAFPLTVVVMRKCMQRFSAKGKICLGLILISISTQLIGPASFTLLPSNLFMTITSILFIGSGIAMVMIPSLNDMVEDATKKISDVRPALISDRVSGLIALAMYVGKATSGPFAGALRDNMSFGDALSIVGFIILAYMIVYGIVAGGFNELAGRRQVNKTDSLLLEKEMVENRKKSFYLLEEDDV